MDENWSSTGCSEDHPYPSAPTVLTIDTVENVFIQNPVAGKWTIQVTATEINQDGHVKYLNDDPTECCAFIPELDLLDPWPPCENPDAQPECLVASPVDADFALVVSGVSKKRACCQQPFGCVDRTQAWCEGHGGVFHCDTWCPTVCEATQGPSMP